MPKKIIAFDLDGTLSESNQKMEEEMAEVLFSLLLKFKVAIISGAAFGQMKKQMEVLLSDERFLKDSKKQKNLYILPISGLSVYQYIGEDEWSHREATNVGFFDTPTIVAALEEIISSKRFGIPEIGKGRFIQERSIDQISFSGLGESAPLEEKRAWDPDHKKRKEIKKELEEKIPDIEVSIGGNSTIDVLPKGWSKARGLLNLLKSLELSKDDILFFGDALFPGGNDYSVKEADIAATKVSGPQETKAILEQSLLQVF